MATKFGTIKSIFILDYYSNCIVSYYISVVVRLLVPVHKCKPIVCIIRSDCLKSFMTNISVESL